MTDISTLTRIKRKLKAWVDEQAFRGTRWGRFVYAVHLFIWQCGVVGKILFRRPSVIFSLRKGDLDPARYASLRLRVFGLRVLREILPACGEAGLRPFLICGTLLGAHREGRFIRDDADIDLGLMAEEQGRVSVLEERMRRAGYLVRIKNPYLISFRKPAYEDIHVDLFYHFRREGQVFTVTPDKEDLLEYPHSADVFEELVGTRFYGQPVLVPGKTEKYLAQKYGDWRTPRRDLDPRNNRDYPNLTVRDAHGHPAA